MRSLLTRYRQPIADHLANRGWRLAGLLATAGGWPDVVQGQPALPPIPPAAPVVSVSRGWYVEAAIVAVMVGLALFVVCRSSRRN